jgi:hypothetical protein
MSALDILRETQIRDEQACEQYTAMTSQHWSGGTERVLGALFRKVNVVVDAVLDINERLSLLETDGK